ncbi:MAG: hypothetical protein L0Y72_31025 [Gemmataceae bacterium]|nr:hypothetical protein [Gemmataceae bacterium]
MTRNQPKESTVDVAALAELLEVDADSASDPVGFVAALKQKLEEVLAQLSGETPEPKEETPEEKEMPQPVVSRRRHVRNVMDEAGIIEAMTPPSLTQRILNSRREGKQAPTPVVNDGVYDMVPPSLTAALLAKQR